MSRRIIFCAGILGLIAVVLSALSSHALEPMLTHSGMIDSFKTATNFLLLHSMMAILAAILHKQASIKLFSWAGWIYIFGSMIFAFPIFLKSINPNTFIGILTPFGGSTLMIGWILLIIASTKIRTKNN